MSHPRSEAGPCVCEVCERRKRTEDARNRVFVWYFGMASFVGSVTGSPRGVLVGAVFGLIVGWLVEKRIV